MSSEREFTPVSPAGPTFQATYPSLRNIEHGFRFRAAEGNRFRAAERSRFRAAERSNAGASRLGESPSHISVG